jgi:hypothetical protein
MSVKAKFQIVCVATLFGCLLSFSHSTGIHILGDLVAVFGFATNLVLLLIPKLGSYRPPQQIK